MVPFYLQIAVGLVFFNPSATDVITTGQVVAEKECHVTTVTIYRDVQYHYDRLRQLYANCTHVTGNLVISDLRSSQIEYDLSFLENIRYVSGYVAIYNNEFPAVVPLPKLEIIRGNYTFSHSPVLGVPDITLLIAVNDHRLVYVPRLREISSGNVLIDLKTSPSLCYLDTIDWSDIVREGTTSISSNEAACLGCSRACEREDNRGRHCWGPTDDLCQWPNGPTVCDWRCGGRCAWNDTTVCCHSQCAVSCFGPSHRDCAVCKDFQLENGACVSHCPYGPRTYRKSQMCISF